MACLGIDGFASWLGDYVVSLFVLTESVLSSGVEERCFLLMLLKTIVKSGWIFLVLNNNDVQNESV